MRFIPEYGFYFTEKEDKEAQEELLRQDPCDLTEVVSVAEARDL